MWALITAALNGLAAIKDLVVLIQDLQLKARLQRLEERQAQMNGAFLSLASSKTPQDLKDALKGIADSWNK